MTLKEFFDYAGYASTTIVGIQLLFIGFSLIKGVLPSLYRLGIGLSKRKILILANPEVSMSLKNLLIDTGLFSSSNVEIAHSPSDLGKIENVKSVILHWATWKESYQEVLRRKKDGCSLIVYAPQKEGIIEKDAYEKLDQERNVIVTNFRGRLLNDIVNSMITSGYVK